MVLDIHIETTDTAQKKLSRDFIRYMKKKGTPLFEVQDKKAESEPGVMGDALLPVMQIVFTSAATGLAINGLFGAIKEYFHWRRDMLNLKNESAKVVITRMRDNNVIETISLYLFDEAERIKFMNFTLKDKK